MDNTQNNNHRFLYFYFNRDEPEKIRQVVPAHVQYWKDANLNGYLGGPFADRTGGSISFLAPSLGEATKIILQDPFALQDLISEKWVKEWVIERERTIHEIST